MNNIKSGGKILNKLKISILSGVLLNRLYEYIFYSKF